MFWLSLAFLAVLAAAIVLVIDVPRVDETIDPVAPIGDAPFSTDRLTIPTASDSDHEYANQSQRLGLWVSGLLLSLWSVFPVEFAVTFALRNRSLPFRLHYPFAWVFCLLPPLRLCRRDREERDRIWFPYWGWQQVDYPLRRKLERAFSFPMIVVALLILPVLILQYLFSHMVAEHVWLRILLHISAGLIWFCFAFEFIVMASVAPSKTSYCKKHWLDLLIIILPLLSFLRMLQSLRGVKLLQATKVQQLAKLARVYRLRGLSMRVFRAILLLDVLTRLMPTNNHKRLVRLRTELEEKEYEISELRKRIAELEARIKQK
jgi:hypothetical protein